MKVCFNHFLFDLNRFFIYSVVFSVVKFDKISIEFVFFLVFFVESFHLNIANNHQLR